MKSLIGVLMGVVIFLLVFSCATVPKKPLASGGGKVIKHRCSGSWRRSQFILRG